MPSYWRMGHSLAEVPPGHPAVAWLLRGGEPADAMFRKEALAVKSPKLGTRKQPSLTARWSRQSQRRTGREEGRQAWKQLWNSGWLSQGSEQPSAPQSEPVNGAVVGSMPSTTMHCGPEFLQNTLF